MTCRKKWSYGTCIRDRERQKSRRPARLRTARGVDSGYDWRLHERSGESPSNDGLQHDGDLQLNLLTNGSCRLPRLPRLVLLRSTVRLIALIAFVGGRLGYSRERDKATLQSSSALIKLVRPQRSTRPPWLAGRRTRCDTTPEILESDPLHSWRRRTRRRSTHCAVG